jgi:hypothetical protein
MVAPPLSAHLIILSHRFHSPPSSPSPTAIHLIAIESSPTIIFLAKRKKKQNNSSFKMEQPIDPDGDEWEYEYHETETEVCQ